MEGGSQVARAHAEPEVGRVCRRGREPQGACVSGAQVGAVRTQADWTYQPHGVAGAAGRRRPW